MKEIPALAIAWAAIPTTQGLLRLDPDARFSDGRPVCGRLPVRRLLRAERVRHGAVQGELLQGLRHRHHPLRRLHHRAAPPTAANPIYFGSIKPRPRNFYKELGADYAQRYQWRFEPTTGPYESCPRT
ncbi:MAG: hypothetical protein U1F77_05820 [Kiritimatiellia bacterium]